MFLSKEEIEKLDAKNLRLLHLIRMSNPKNESVLFRMYNEHHSPESLNKFECGCDVGFGGDETTEVAAVRIGDKIHLIDNAIEVEKSKQELRRKAILNTIDQMVEFTKTLNELKNKKPMEITEDTKIKDLIPEGYELETKILKDVNLGIFREYINIPVKKKEVKDFDWYAQRYFDKIKKRLRIELIINSDFADVDFPFEFKIGLLKFICDDLGVNVEAFIIAKSFGGGGSYAKVEGICPPEFLNSIFK